MNKHYRKYLESKGVDVSKIKPRKPKKNKEMNKNTNKLNKYSKSTKYVIYTDFCSNLDLSKDTYSWYYCIYDTKTNKLVYEDSGTDTSGFNMPYCLAGELSAVINAVNYCSEHNYTNICINYHNSGIKGWTDDWKANNIYTKFYAEIMNKYKHVKYTFSDYKKHMTEIGFKSSRRKAKKILVELCNKSC